MALSLGEGRRRTLTLAGIAVVVIAVAVGAAIQFDLIDVGGLLGEKKAPPPAAKPAAGPVAAAKSEPAKTEPAKAEAPKAEAPKGEPAKGEPAKGDAAKGGEAAKPAPAAPQGEPAEVARGKIIIPGDWAWNAETNEVTQSGGGDILWEQANPTERELVPQKGAGLALAPGAKYDDIGAPELAALKYSAGNVSGSDKGGSLEPGAVFGLRTTEGNLAKVRVIGYRSSHDVTFPGSNILSQSARQKLRIRPPIARYHLEVEWVLYRPQTAVAVAAAPKAPKPAPAAAPDKPAAAAEKPAAADKGGASAVAALEKLQPEAKGGAPAAAAAARKPSGPRRALAAAAPSGPPPQTITTKYNDVMTAVLYGDRAAVTQLLDLGKWIDRPDERGYTPLMVAATNRDAAMAELLLSRGANPNAEGDGGTTALTIARENRDNAMVSLLQKRGAK